MNIQRIIEVVPYNTDWPNLFSIEKNRIQDALGENCIGIHHIGSTSVPGLAAKPVIDMIPVVRDIMKVDNSNNAMQQLGYEAKGEYGIAFRRYFQKGAEYRTHHAHVFEEGSPEIERHLKFRDWMRSHPSDLDAYAALKQELAKNHPNDIMAYCLGKEAFIADIDNKAGCFGLRIVKSLTPREWEAVRHFRQHYFFDKVPISDPYTWTFDHEAHVHFILYKGTQIKGYAHIQLWPEQRAALRIMVIEEHSRNQGIGGAFLNLCERWLYQQGIVVLQMESSPEAKKFYVLQGYIEMPFNDPENGLSFPQDIPMGKMLVKNNIT